MIKQFFTLPLFFLVTFQLTAQVLQEYPTEKFVDSVYVSINRRITKIDDKIHVEDFYVENGFIEELYQLNEAPKKFNNTYKVGTAKSFFMTGQIKQLRYFDAKGQYEGTHTNFYENGNKQFEKIFKDNKIVSTEKYFKNGLVEERIVPNAKTGIDSVFKYYSNNKLKSLEIRKELEKGKEKVTYLLDYFDQNGTQQISEGNGEFLLKDSLGVEVEKGNYEKGLKTGNWSGFWQEKKATYTEIYEKGIFKTGEIIDSTGKKIIYKELALSPEFKGGIANLYKFIGENLKYPTDALRNNISGKSFVKFEIEIDGSIKSAETILGVSPSIDQESRNIVLKTSGKWICGYKRGLPTKTLYTMPISFRIN